MQLIYSKILHSEIHNAIIVTCIIHISTLLHEDLYA